MKIFKKIGGEILTAVLLSASIASQTINIKAEIQPSNGDGNNPQTPSVNNFISVNEKLSPELQQIYGDFVYGQRNDGRINVVAQLKAETEINSYENGNIPDQIREEIFARELNANKAKSSLLKASVEGMNGAFKKAFNHVGLVSVEILISRLDDLARNPNVDYISFDTQIESFGHLESTTGYGNSSIQSPSLLPRSTEKSAESQSSTAALIFRITR